MADEKDTPELPSDVEKQTIREVIAGRHERLMFEQFEVERTKRRNARDKRATERKEARETQGRQDKARQRKATHEAKERAGEHVRQASQAIRAALRDLQSVAVSRHSSEGRDQLREVRSLEAALGSLRSVGRGGAYDESLDDGADLDTAI